MPTLLDTTRDPLARFRDGAWIARSDHPLPLVDTAIDVRILGGLAIVRTARTFRNAEERSIEATITFPVPVHATIVALSASIDGRLLMGRAQRKQAAREAYERAIDEGNTAVLHEEALRGVHILSIGHIPPGKDIVVTSTWAMPVVRHETGAMVRIPVTVGDIFGRSPLPDSDDPIHARETKSANLTIRCDPGIAAFRDAALVNGVTRVLLNRPIDILLPHWVPRTLRGTAADGRMVTLEITQADAGDAPLRSALLLDVSGSMSQAVSAGRTAFGGSPVAPSKHQVMVDGVSRALAALGSQDAVSLWQFNTRCAPVYALSALAGPEGGTSIGHALAEVVRHADATDIAIVTDGKSHDIDVQALALSGRRFTAVLVGEDSLDAYIGHLAALTGGQLFVVPGKDAAEAIMAAVRSMRCQHIAPAPISGQPIDLTARVGGMDIWARWERAGDMGQTPNDLGLAMTAPGDHADELQVIGAVAAAMAIPRLQAEAAAEMAESHGIVCHLTSLVMIDEASVAQNGIPIQRKVPLMTPATQRADGYSVPFHSRRAVSYDQPRGAGAADVRRRSPDATRHVMAPAPARPAVEQPPVPSGIGSPAERTPDFVMSLIANIDWSRGEKLRQGDVSSLPPAVMAIVAWAAKLDTVEKLARSVQAQPPTVVLALMAKQSADFDRAAARLFRAVLGKADPELLAAALRDAGFQQPGE